MSQWQVICHYVEVATESFHGDGVACQPPLRIGMAIIRLDPVDLEVGGPLHDVEPCHESSRAIDITDNDGWSGSSCGMWSNSGSADSRSDDVASGGPSDVAEISWLNWLEGSIRVAPFSVILFSVEDLIRMARVMTPVNAAANVVELVEMAPNVPARLVDLQVGVGLGIAWRLTKVDDVVSS